jgi:hypothetical protein
MEGSADFCPQLGQVTGIGSVPLKGGSAAFSGSGIKSISSPQRHW